jgi:curved DNA-binding protein CbpA
MAEADFYKILGVSSSASADEIKSAYRELVKKYHPDLFSTSADKIHANDKLRQINEAYAALGDAARRRDYDQKRSSKPKPTISKTASASPSGRRHSSMRNSTRRSSRSAQKSTVKTWKYAVSPKWVGGILGVAIFALVAHALWDAPQVGTAWTLLERTVVEPSKSVPGQRPAAPNWTVLGSYGFVSECADALRTMVKRDEQEGSKAVFDERKGTMGITVHVKDEPALALEYFNAKLQRTLGAAEKPPAEDQQLLREQAVQEAKEFIRKNGITRRVRNYECRHMQVVKPESWLRRKLRGVGIIS